LFDKKIEDAFTEMEEMTNEIAQRKQKELEDAIIMREKLHI